MRKTSTRTALELRYEQIKPKPQFPIETYKMILAIGIKEGEYPFMWRYRNPSVQQFMRSLHPNCEWCGVDAAGFPHDVHHLKWDKKHDCRYDNLFVVCRSCHSRLHRRGWYPSKPWDIGNWGAVPQGLISRGYLNQDGSIIDMMDNNSVERNERSERKNPKTKRSRNNSKVSA